MKKTICLLFLAITLVSSPSSAATAFWGEDLPLIDAELLDQCSLPQFRAKVSLTDPAVPSSSKQLEVWEDPECGSGNVRFYFRLEVASGLLSYSIGGPGGTGGEVLSVPPKDDSNYPVLIRKMVRVLQKIQNGTNPFSADILTPTAYENATIIAGYLQGNALRKFPQIQRVNHPAEVQLNQSFDLTFRVSGEIVKLESLVIDIWDGNSIVQSLNASPLEVDPNGRGLYRLTVPSSLVSGFEFRWSARTKATTKTQKIFSVRDERPDFLAEQLPPYFSIPIVN